jgi:hypothetical protein
MGFDGIFQTFCRFAHFLTIATPMGHDGIGVS